MSDILTVKQAVEMFMEHRQLNSASPATLKLYHYYLRVWQEWRESRQLCEVVQDMEIEEFRQFMTHLTTRIPHRDNKTRCASSSTGWAPSTQERIWSLLRTLWNFLADEELLDSRQIKFFQKQRIPQPKVKLTVREIYTDEQIEALLHACDEHYYQDERSRNKAIILVLLESGMRVSELCSMRDDRMDLRDRQAIVIGKGGNDRYVFWGPRAGAEMVRYSLARPPVKKGAFFRSLSDPEKPLKPDAVRSMLRRLAKCADITLPKCPVHSFRHTFARRALIKGLDGLHLQQLMDHASSRTTERYVKECPEQLRKMHRGLWKSDGDAENPESHS